MKKALLIIPGSLFLWFLAVYNFDTEAAPGNLYGNVSYGQKNVGPFTNLTGDIILSGSPDGSGTGHKVVWRDSSGNDLGSIWFNIAHPNELQINSVKSMSLNLGGDGQNNGVLQIGTSGATHEVGLWQYDFAVSGGSPLGYSKPMVFGLQYFSGATKYRYPNLQAVANDAAGNYTIDFYDGNLTDSLPSFSGSWQKGNYWGSIGANWTISGNLTNSGLIKCVGSIYCNPIFVTGAAQATTFFQDADRFYVGNATGTMISSDTAILFSSTTSASGGAKDLGLWRQSAGVLVVTNASGTGLYGSVNAQLTILAKTSNYTVTKGDTGTFFNNTGAGAAQTNTLPTAVAGLHYGQYVDAAQFVCFRATGSDTIRNAASVSTAAGGLFANTVGNSVHLVCHVAGKWSVESIVGTWTTF